MQDTTHDQQEKQQNPSLGDLGYHDGQDSRMTTDWGVKDSQCFTPGRTCQMSLAIDATTFPYIPRDICALTHLCLEPRDQSTWNYNKYTLMWLAVSKTMHVGEESDRLSEL